MRKKIKAGIVTIHKRYKFTPTAAELPHLWCLCFVVSVKVSKQCPEQGSCQPFWLLKLRQEDGREFQTSLGLKYSYPKAEKQARKEEGGATSHELTHSQPDEQGLGSD